MKAFLAFALALSLGLVCAVGCNKPAEQAPPPKPKATELDKKTIPPPAKAGEAKPADTKPAETKPADKAGGS